MVSSITHWVKPEDKSGEFKRQQSSFRNRISREANAEFPPERGRYHLYVSYACPWAHRTLITRKLKGLEDIISVSVVHWHLQEKGWRFATAEDTDVPGADVVPDPVAGHEAYTHLRDVYFAANPAYDARFTVPVLWDKQRQTIVSNESADILRMLSSEFDDLLAAAPAVDGKAAGTGARGGATVDLYPEALRAETDATYEWVYELINNGVYKSGFATTQEAYERAVVALFGGLDRAEEHLAATARDGPYWFGKTLTAVDVQLYVTIIRFDPVYVQHFKCNLRDIRSGYPAIHRWMRTLYWTVPAFHDTTNFEHIKWHYTRSHTQINPTAITSLGPLPDVLPLDDEVPAVKAAIAIAAAANKANSQAKATG